MAFPMHKVMSFGDSLVSNDTLSVLPEEFWPALLEAVLNGYAQSAVVSVSGSTLTVSPGTGPFFPAKSWLQLLPLVPGELSVWNARNAQWGGPVFAVQSVAGDVLTLDRAPFSGTPAGVVVAGRGGPFATSAAAGVADVAVRNEGHSGYTSPQILGLVANLAMDGDYQNLPDVAIIAAGLNDYNGTSISTVLATGTNNGTTDTFTLANAGYNVAMAAITGQFPSYLTIGGLAGWKVTNIAGDVLTVLPPSGTAAANLAAGTAVIIDTTNTVAQIGKACLSYGVPKILLSTSRFINEASGGDPTAPGSTTTGRTAQLAAGTILTGLAPSNVIVADAWEFMRNRVYTGIDSLNGSYHVSATNTHCNPYGNSVWAMAAAAAIPAQWFIDLAADAVNDMAA